MSTTSVIIDLKFILSKDNGYEKFRHHRYVLKNKALVIFQDFLAICNSFYRNKVVDVMYSLPSHPGIAMICDNDVEAFMESVELFENGATVLISLAGDNFDYPIARQKETSE